VPSPGQEQGSSDECRPGDETTDTDRQRELLAEKLTEEHRPAATLAASGSLSTSIARCSGFNCSIVASPHRWQILQPLGRAIRLSESAPSPAHGTLRRGNPSPIWSARLRALRLFVARYLPRRVRVSEAAIIDPP